MEGSNRLLVHIELGQNTANEIPKPDEAYALVARLMFGEPIYLWTASLLIQYGFWVKDNSIALNSVDYLHIANRIAQIREEVLLDLPSVDEHSL